jgi:hypothetical protein
MGSRPPGNQQEATDSVVSPLWVVGSVFTPLPPDPKHTNRAVTFEVAGQTAVDRQRGAAAAGPLRFSRLAADGGELTVYLRHDAESSPLTDDDLRLLASWQPAIGRDRTKGSGRAVLSQLRYGTVDPATPDGTATWLTQAGPDLFTAVAVNEVTCSPPDDTPWLEASFTITDGLLTSDGVPAKVAQSRRRGGKPLITGSSWKGLIRSRSEYIIRSRYGDQAACQDLPGCGRCPACALFGHAGQRGLLAFRDSYIEDAPVKPEARTQVGIDRVTGGARDALLFQTAPLTKGKLRLQVDALAPVPPWARNLIGHVLRDIDDGLIGVGSRTTRGLGTLHLTSQLDELQPVRLPELDELTETGGHR